LYGTETVTETEFPVTAVEAFAMLPLTLMVVDAFAVGMPWPVKELVTAAIALALSPFGSTAVRAPSRAAVVNEFKAM
jgi:hypothetical protein